MGDPGASEKRTSISLNRDYDGASARANIALQVENLLPGAEDRFAFGERHRERRTEERGLKMRVPVAIVPGLLVAVVAAGRDELVQDFRKVALESRLKFNCADAGRASDGEDVDDAGANTGCRGDGRNVRGEVVHMSVAAGGERNLLLVSHAMRITTRRGAGLADRTDFIVAAD